MKKANIGIQTFFMIMMSILMVGIMIFGISRFFMVKDTLSEIERVEIMDKLKSGLEYCNDPLNKGTKKTIELDYDKIGAVCFLGADVSINYDVYGFEETYQAGDNIIVLERYVIPGAADEDVNILETFYVEKEYSETKCYDTLADKALKITCE